MPGANPLIAGGIDNPIAAEPSVGYEPPAAESGLSNKGFLGSGMASMSGFTSVDNTSTHVAVLVVGAAVVIGFLYWGGFGAGISANVGVKG